MKLYAGTKECDLEIDFDENLEATVTTRMPSERRYGNFGYAWRGDSLFAPTPEGLTEYSHDLKKKKVHTVKEKYNDPHQMLVVGDVLYETNCGTNSLRTYNFTTGQWKVVPVLSIEWAKKRAVKHLNAVNLIDGKLHFVAHNYNWSALLTFDLELNFIDGIENVGHCCHNIWKMNGKTWVLSSGEGYVQTVGGGAMRNRLDLGGFVRGVALNAKYLFVGISMIRDSGSTFAVPRSSHSVLGMYPSAGIAVLDATTLDLKKFVPLPNIAEIFEIRLVGEPDLAVYTDPGNEIFRWLPS